MDQYFTLTDQHITLLSNLYIDPNGYNGGPGANAVRPFGNRDYVGDMIKILGEPVADPDEGPTDEQYTRMEALFGELATALQVILLTRAFRPGRYRKAFRYDDQSWVYEGSE